MQSRRRFICGCLGALSACTLFPTASPARIVDFLPPSDPADGKTFRAICMHDVRDNLLPSLKPMDAIDPYAIDTGTLTAIFSWLAVNDYHVLTLKQIEASRRGGPSLPPRSILLTFDDGYRSHYTKVLPLLRQFGYSAVMGIVTGWIDAPENQPIRISDTVEVPREFFMTWDQVNELNASGLIELASHTHALHHGATANPQGNQLPATTSHLYFQDLKRYETDQEFDARVRDDLSKSIQLIRNRTGFVARSMVWPYGAENKQVRTVSTSLGMKIQFSLEAGPNSPDVPLDRLRRILMTYDVEIGGFERSMREPASNRGEINTVERVVQINLDDIYDPQPAEQERKLGNLIERIYRLQPKTVYLQAFSDTGNDGIAESVYFPNRHFPLRSDLFSRAAWQLHTRANVQVYAWMPVLAFRAPVGAVGIQPLSAIREAASNSRREAPPRLSPFDPQARQLILDLYEDLGKYSTFDGLLFGNDARPNDFEDNSESALKTYSTWGLPPDIQKIRSHPDLLRQWTRQKSKYLVDFTLELEKLVLDNQNGGSILTARVISVPPVVEPELQVKYSQNYDEFLAAYDYVVLEADPYGQDVSDPDQWIDSIVSNVSTRPNGLQRTVFDLHAYDSRTNTAVQSTVLLAQMRRLRMRGALNFGYYPDRAAQNEPNIEIMRDVISLKSRLDRTSIEALMKASQHGYALR